MPRHSLRMAAFGNHRGTLGTATVGATRKWPAQLNLRHKGAASNPCKSKPHHLGEAILEGVSRIRVQIGRASDLKTGYRVHRKTQFRPKEKAALQGKGGQVVPPF